MARNGSGQYDLPVNSWNPATNGNAATTVDWQDLIDDVASALTQSVSADGQTPMTGSLNMNGNKIENLANAVANDDAATLGQVYSQGIEQSLASASTTDIGSVNSNFVLITGTTSITSLGANYNGPRFVRFNGALTLTHNASTLLLPGGANITTAANDRAIFIPKGNPSDGWNCVAYQYASGVMATAPQTQNGTLVFLTSVAGTNTITATAPYPFTAYAEGQVFRFKAANAPTGAVTININSVGAKALQLHGAALTGYEYPANAYLEIEYDGTAFQLISSSANRSFLYTPTITNNLNLDSSTSHPHMMTREWNIVRGAGELDFDSTAAGGTVSQAFISVPEISANFSAINQASGNGTSVLSSGAQSSYAAIRAESGTQTLRVYFNSNVTTNTLFFTNYSYRIMG